MANADLQIKGGGGWGSSRPRDTKEPGLKTFFFSALRGSVLAKNKRGRGRVPGPPGASTGSATAEG